MKSDRTLEGKTAFARPDPHAETWDLAETAHVLKCSPQTLLELAESGEVPGCKVAVQWVFLREAITRYLWMQTEAQQSARRVKSGFDKKIAAGVVHETRRQRRRKGEAVKIVEEFIETSPKAGS